MSISDFFRDAPVLATFLALGYAALVCVFICMMVKMYRN